jgi:hypothetical protein
MDDKEVSTEVASFCAATAATARPHPEAKLQTRKKQTMAHCKLSLTDLASEGS